MFFIIIKLWYIKLWASFTFTGVSLLCTLCLSVCFSANLPIDFFFYFTLIPVPFLLGWHFSFFLSLNLHFNFSVSYGPSFVLKASQRAVCWHLSAVARRSVSEAKTKAPLAGLIWASAKSDELCSQEGDNNLAVTLIELRPVQTARLFSPKLLHNLMQSWKQLVAPSWVKATANGKWPFTQSEEILKIEVIKSFFLVLWTK